MYCELGSCFSIPFPEYWERALRNLILVLIFETVMNATNHCHSWARILLMFHHQQQHQHQHHQQVPALFSWAGIYFVIISPWSNISTRRGYRYKIIIIWLRQFSLRIWRELVIGDGAVTLHNLVVVCFHIPAGVIFIRRHISTFSYRYYRYLHHCCVSRKHNSAQYTAWSCIVPIYRPVFVILILQWPGAPPTTICHRACNNLAGDICHRKAISSPASAACIQLPPAHRKLDLCTAPLHV